MYCSHAVAFLFSKATKFDFLLWLFRPTQKHIFSFLVLHFLVKNWNYCGASIKEMGRNSKHTILWLGLHGISKVQRSLPNPRYEEFPCLCGVLKCKCIYNPVWVRTRKGAILQNFKWIVTLQKFRSPTKKWKVIIKIWFTVNQNSFTLMWRKMIWSPMNVVSNDCGLKIMWSQMIAVSNECGLKWKNLMWMWSQMNRHQLSLSQMYWSQFSAHPWM